MSRAPFPIPTPSAGNQPGRLATPPNPGVTPAAPARKSSQDRRTLIVGHGINLQGTVQDAERLVVEGKVETSSILATELAIRPEGVFLGEAEVQDVEVAGIFDGTLTAHDTLIIRATGRLMGYAKCRRLQVEDGGQVTGQLEMITTPATGQTEAPRPASSSAAPAAHNAVEEQHTAHKDENGQKSSESTDSNDLVAKLLGTK